MEKDRTEEALNTVINGLINSITDEANARIPVRVVEEIKDSYMARNAESYSVCVDWKVQEVMDAIVKLIIPDYETYPNKVKNEMVYIWRHYSSIEHYISELISKFEGVGCSVDKGRWLLNSYMTYIQTEKMPDMTIEEKCFWKPHFGTAETWMKWIHSYILNTYRPEVDFFSLTSVLLQEGLEYRQKITKKDS